jgi:hypothetical protein
MTEDAWFRLTRPYRMLGHVAAAATERRLRLLAVACQRWSYPFRESAAEAVLLAVERLADGIETTDDVAMLGALPVWERRSWNRGPAQAVTVAGMQGALPAHRSNEVERAAQCALIRDIFGNPFRPVALSPEWRTDTAVTLTRQMYESRDFSDMPILADTLEEGGCDSADTLDHCRGAGPHVRGCCVVDQLSGKS